MVPSGTYSFKNLLMISKTIKSVIQKIAQSMGYHVLSKNSIAGDMVLSLSGIRDRGLKVESILDVGANTGEWSQMASGIFPNAEFFLIEPQIEMKAPIEAFFKNQRGNWILGGAGSTSGELLLTVWDDHAGSSFLVPEHGESGGDKEQRKVPVYTVDELVASGKIKIPTLCKLDVQGFELEVLKGASSIFGKTEVFILEVGLFKFLPNQPLIEEVIAFMKERGYVIYDFPGFSNRPLDGALGQIDICFAKEDGYLRASHQW
ncbi:methyltransferase, FkbM family [Spirosomataceae bacterium TFI 002]|nr:methyltransferase, FkbM family [Spirosomataceae bacterium TFI 002]